MIKRNDVEIFNKHYINAAGKNVSKTQQKTVLKNLKLTETFEIPKTKASGVNKVAKNI